MNQRETDNDSGIERKFLGNILNNPETILPLMAFLRSEDFYYKEHQTIYEAVLHLISQGEPFDFITVADELEKRNKLDEIGGTQYIDSLLTQAQPTESLFPSETLYPDSGIDRQVISHEEKPVDTVLLYNQEELMHPEIRNRLIYLSPSFRLLEKIFEETGSFLDKLQWRQFEEIVATLLELDGYQVQLGSGTKDGGKDIIAMKELEGHGWFMSVWQAKKLNLGNKVGLSVIRELADTRQKQNASKGIIVTSTYLTRGALDRITEDKFLLGKIDRVDLLEWIRKVKRKYR